MQDNFELNGMKIKVMVVGPVQTNCYILNHVLTKKAIVIDPGEEADRILSYIRAEELCVEAILLTHGHFDHISAVNDICSELSVPVYAHEIEEDVLGDENLNCSQFCGGSVTVFNVTKVTEGQKLNIAGFDLEVIHTPGHTHGSVCYYFRNNGVLFSGDTLFFESVGRTDLPTGNGSAMIKSVKKKLALLNEETYVFPGHGNTTTIGYEVVNNPYMNDLDF